MVSSSRPTKRQRREHPITPLDHESVSCVASSKGPISSPIVSTLDKEIVLERLEKEIVQRFELQLSVPRGNKITTISTNTATSSTTTKRKERKSRAILPKSLKRRVIESRLSIGVNQCTRALEKNGSSVQLVLLCHDVHPPTMVAHIPALAADAVPILILPGGHASLELGRVLGIPRATVLVIQQRQEVPLPIDGTMNDDSETTTIQMHHDKIDSFVEFVKSKQPGF